MSDTITLSSTIHVTKVDGEVVDVTTQVRSQYSKAMDSVPYISLADNGTRRITAAFYFNAMTVEGAEAWIQMVKALMQEALAANPAEFGAMVDGETVATPDQFNPAGSPYFISGIPVYESSNMAKA